MSFLVAPVFFILYGIGNLPDPLRPTSLTVRLLLNVGSKILLAYFLYFSRVESFGTTFVFLNFTMLLSIAFALYTDNYSRFFERTDLTQSIFLVNMFAIGLPIRDLPKFLAIFFIPYLASNAILVTVGFFKERECNQRVVYVENFYGLFGDSKILTASMCLALAFLLGVPPLHGFRWRVEFLEVVHGRGQIWSFVVYVICLCALGYAYFRWIMAIFQSRSIPRRSAESLFSCYVDWFVLLCAIPMAGCFLLARN
jgi:NADH:ubiquinone oxidoreductase subunit 2 (subunit N)